MPAKPRRLLIDPEVCTVYHCHARCVRRAYLCGIDPLTGRNYEHRKVLICGKIRELLTIFALELAWKSILDNHFHLILRLRMELLAQWSAQEVIRRACRLFPSVFRKRGVKEGVPTPEQLELLAHNERLVRTMRERLGSISWFMKRLCEWIAKMANAEDEVTGHFFEGRFQSHPLLDETGILLCGTYVDLNWIRAGKALTPETSYYSSAYDRIQGLQARQAGAPPEQASQHDGYLTPLGFDGDGQVGYPPGQRLSDQGMLPITLNSYLALLDWTGRQLRTDKAAGAIPADLPPILVRLGLDEPSWLASMQHFKRWFKTAVGRTENLAQFAQRLGQRWLHGLKSCQQAFAT